MLLEDKSVLESIKKRIWFSFVASILLTAKTPTEPSTNTTL